MLSRVRIVHIINSFEFGGAEAMLCNLVLRSDRSRFDISVISLIDDLRVAAPLIDHGIPITVIGMKPGIPDPRLLVSLGQYLRSLRPAVIQTWMDHSNLLGGLAARMAPRAAVVWGIHHSHHVAELTKRSTLMTVAACARVSNFLPARIVFCSEHAKKLYSQHGFRNAGMVVIPNGFDTKAYSPNPAARADVRQELSLDDNIPLVGLVARYDPLKDHATFLLAAQRIARIMPEAHFVLCGNGIDARNTPLTTQINNLGLTQRCHLLGPRHDVPRVLASLDILVSSSISEAFPLAVGEAMACGVPCAVTDVGDSALMVGDAGRVVPPSQPQALGDACLELLQMPSDQRVTLGAQGRQRVMRLFDLDAITGRYQKLYLELAHPGRAHKPSRASLPEAPPCIAN